MSGSHDIALAWANAVVGLLVSAIGVGFVYVAFFPGATERPMLDEVAGDSIESVRSLLEAPAPAVLTTYRKDGSALVSPVWFRWSDGVFEVVIAKGDLKLGHLARDPRCVLVVFEAVRPFRGIEVRGVSELVEGDAGSVRAVIAARYLGAGDGARFAAERTSTPGVVLRLACESPRIWDLSGILPT